MVPMTNAAAGFIPGSLFGTPGSWGSVASSTISGLASDGGPDGAGDSTFSTMLTGIQRSSMAALAPSAAPSPETGIEGRTVSAAPLGDLLTQSVGQVEQLETEARYAVEGLISGKGVDVHEAMIATEKAEMGFELVLAVRNKALAAYQQVVGMQF